MKRSTTRVDANVIGESDDKSHNLSINDVMDIIKSLPSTAFQSHNHFSMSTNTVPEFDPANKEQTIDLWISKVEECAAMYNWSEIQLLHYALPKLIGLAKVWYHGLDSLNHSWAKWKELLTKQFPTVQNYAQMLHEMLDRKVRHNETLETYYYHKINLLNRCNIIGKRAVDCLIYGLEDKGMRLGAQAANYSHPEELLAYFKSIKIEDTKDKSYRQPFLRRRVDGPTNNVSRSTTLRCFNCSEVGHPSFKCTKPLLTCSICKRIGHQSANCKRLFGNNQDVNKQVEKGKSVSEVKLAGSIDNKYVLPIVVNNKPMTCYVDLGSQSTLVRISDFKDLQVAVSTDNLPTLKGFGNSIIEPLGKAVVQIQVQSVRMSVEVLIVPDELLKYPVLLGHTFTEHPGVVIVKTDEHLIFQQLSDFQIDSERDKEKINLVVNTEVTLKSINMIPIEVNTKSDINVFVSESLRHIGTSSYYVMPGLYTIVQGKGHVMVVNLNSQEIKFKKGQLFTRACVIGKDECLNVRMVECNKEDEISKNLKCGGDLNDDDKARLEALLIEYKDCFSFSFSDLGLTNLTEMSINLRDTAPIVYRPYRLAYSERNKVKEMIQEMLDSGIIVESNSAYASPIILVQKKTGDQRLCVDYRALNAKTVKEHHPLPRIEDQIDQLGGFEYFITLDFATGYYQIPISESSQDKTAFVTPDGQYQFKVMPFGLANAPSTFQKTMNKLLKDVKDQMFAFMDDIIIPIHSIPQGMERLRTILELIKAAGLTLKLSKCTFFSREIDYLGFQVSSKGVRPGSKKN